MDFIDFLLLLLLLLLLLSWGVFWHYCKDATASADQFPLQLADELVGGILIDSLVKILLKGKLSVHSPHLGIFTLTFYLP